MKAEVNSSFVKINRFARNILTITLRLAQENYSNVIWELQVCQHTLHYHYLIYTSILLIIWNLQHRSTCSPVSVRSAPHIQLLHPPQNIFANTNGVDNTEKNRSVITWDCKIEIKEFFTLVVTSFPSLIKPYVVWYCCDAAF